MDEVEKGKQIQYVDYVETRHVPGPEDLIVKRVRPKRFNYAYHHHASVELNFLSKCEQVYSFSGTKLKIPAGRLVMFWGSIPHGVIDVIGKGHCDVVYLPLSLILNWGLPNKFIELLLGGSVIASKDTSQADRLIFDRWQEDFAKDGVMWRQLLLGEIQMRIRRLALEGHDILMSGKDQVNIDVAAVASRRYIDDMLRFISENFGKPLSVTDVAEHVSLSPSYAMTLFKKIVGIPINEHITRTRLSHAQMLLANSDDKILSVAMDSGFGSLSSFYEAFQSRIHKTPAAFRKATRA